MSFRPRVLVIDDDADMRILLSTLLDHLDAEVRAAADEVEAEAALRYAPDLVLLDLVMPNGLFDAVITRLLNAEASPLIALVSGSSAQTLDQERERLRGMGLRVEHTLIKPVRIDALSALLATLPGAG
jgi:CheY-like chemotaxis protein